MTCKKTKDNGEGRYSSRSAGVADGLWMTMTIPVVMITEMIKSKSIKLNQIEENVVEDEVKLLE